MRSIGRIDVKRAEAETKALSEAFGLDLDPRAAVGSLPVGLRHASQVRGGEIVGLAGVQGNGQDELVECIAGLRMPRAGTITIAGRPIGDTPAANRDIGLAYIPADRDAVGLSQHSAIWENLIIGHLREFQRGPFLAVGGARRRAQELIAMFDVRGAELDKPARSLSGGNQQKVQIARELTRDARVIVAEQPSQGVDIGAIEQIRRILVECAARENRCSSSPPI